MGDVAAALHMLNTFAECGAQSFCVTKTELEWPGHKKAKWGKTYSAAELRQKLPSMVRTAAIRRRITLPDGETVMAGENLILRPTGPRVAFVQLDDLGTEQLDHVRPAACIIHSTSPKNHQAWIAVSGAPEGEEQFKEFVRRVRKTVGKNDKAASHATRAAGTENFKTIYRPNYPIVTILESYPGRVMTPEQLESLGLLAKPEPVKALSLKFTRRAGYRSGRDLGWPSYEAELADAPPNRDGSGPDRSTADFWWCYHALDRGFSPMETESKLLDVSKRARQRHDGGDPGYVRVTVKNAAARLELNRQRSRA